MHRLWFCNNLPTVDCPSARSSCPRLQLQRFHPCRSSGWALPRGGGGSLLSPWLRWTAAIFCCCQSGHGSQTARPRGCTVGGQGNCLAPMLPAACRTCWPGPAPYHLVYLHTHASLSRWTSCTKHRFKEKIITNFKMARAEC